MDGKQIYLLVSLLEDTWCVYKKSECTYVKVAETLRRAEGAPDGREII
jgi:hypothetical protein